MRNSSACNFARMGFHCSIDGNECAGFTVEDLPVPEIGEIVEYGTKRYRVRTVTPPGRRAAATNTTVQVHLTPVKEAD